MLSVSILALAAAGGGALSLSASSPKTTVLVGEPVKLVLKWRATAPVAISPDNLGFAVDDGAGPRLYLGHVLEARNIYGEPQSLDFHVVNTLKAGAGLTTNLILVRGSYTHDQSLEEHRERASGRNLTPSGFEPSFVFPRPGHYAIKVQHYMSPSRGALAESNAVAFTVVEPRGDDLAVFQRVAKNPEILAGREEAEALLRKYPQSAYLRWAKIRRIGQMDANVGNGYDPEKGIGANQAPLHKEERELMSRNFHERVAQELLSDEEWGAFEEERLALGLQHARDEGIAAIFRKMLFDKFPDSRAVNEIKKEERESGESDEGSDSDVAQKLKPSPSPSPR